MAKSGTINASVGANDPIGLAVVSQDAPIMTLGQMVAAALSGSNSPEVVYVTLENRTAAVYSGSEAQAMSAEIEAANSREEFVPDDENAKTGPWTASKASPLAPVANAALKPSRSLASLVSAIEDFIANNPAEVGRYIAIDQVTGKVSVFSAAAGDNIPAAAIAPSAVFFQTVADSTTTLRNAFE